MCRGVTKREWASFAAAVFVFFLIRLPLFFEPAVRLGWHSDGGAFGLMARDIYEGRFHLFFFGQSYMGTLTSMFGALGGAIVAAFGVTPAVGPLGMRIGLAIEWVLMMFCYWLAFRIAFGSAVAVLVALLLATGPDWFFHSSLAPRGAEMLLLMSGAILLVGVRGLHRRRDWFLFGLLSGIGWWMHQGVFFTIGAVLIVMILRSHAWAIFRASKTVFDTLLLRGVPPVLQLINAVLLMLLAAGVLRDFIPRFPAFFLHQPIAEPLVAWMIYRFVIGLIYDSATRDALAHLRASWRTWMPRAALFLGGALIAYSPVIAGRFLGMYEQTYGFSAPFQTAGRIPAQVARVFRSDFWTLIGGSLTPLGVMTVVPLVVLLVSHMIRNPRPRHRARAIAGATLLLCAAFYFGSSRAYAGAVRYIAPAVPILFAFALAEAEAWWRGEIRALRIAAAAAVAMIVIGYAIQSMRLVDDITSARAEGRFFTGAGFTSGPTFDPRPTMRAIDEGGYNVCYAHYAVGINLEWLLDRRVQFIAHNSVEVRRALARRLAATPGRKCFVDWNGNVRPWDPREHDDSIGRTAAERLRRRRGIY